jgi:hypothetical protein
MIPSPSCPAPKAVAHARVMTNWLRIGLLIVAGLSLSGCIRSRVMLTSEPSGAEVTWRGQYRGITPIEIPIIWYWYYDYSLEKEGYLPVEKVERFRTPPWFLLPVDLFAEIIPFPFPDRRERHYVLEVEPEQY